MGDSDGQTEAIQITLVPPEKSEIEGAIVLPTASESSKHHKKYNKNSYPDFPVNPTKAEMIAYIIDKQNTDYEKACKEKKMWQMLFIGQLIFWIILFTTGKTWLGWFPLP